MNALSLAAAAMAAVEARDMHNVAAALADDFVYLGTGRTPRTRSDFPALQSAVCAGLPDFAFNTSKMLHEGDKVWATIQISGTHLADLDLSALAMPVIPATGIYCLLPKEQVEFTLHQGCITRHRGPPRAGRRHPRPAGAAWRRSALRSQRLAGYQPGPQKVGRRGTNRPGLT